MRTPAGDGLQASRTTLSWRRTVASAGAVAGLVLHHLLAGPAGLTVFTTLVVTTAGLAALALAASGTARSRSLHCRSSQVSPLLVLLTAGSVAVTAAAALTETLLS